MSYQFTAGRFKGWASDNTPLAAGRLYTYSSGTTTQKNVYTDATLGAACTYVSDGVGGLYIALDSKGEAQLWLGSGAYTFKLTDASGSTVWTVDGVRDQVDSARTDLANTADGSKGASLVGGAARAVDSIAALRALPKTGSPRVITFGYYAAGDGGEGEYWYDSTDTTSSDNGGTIIVASDGGRWKLAYSTAISVKQFGAKADGVTDDYAAFANTWAAIKQTGGILNIPPGNYLLNTQLVLDVDTSLPHNYLIIGYGATLFAGPSVTGHAIMVYKGFNNFGVRIEGLQFNHRGNSTVNGCIQLQGAVNCQIIKCAVECHGTKATYSGIEVGPHTPGDGNTNSFWTLIDGFTTRQRSGGDGTLSSAGVRLLGSANASKIINCSFNSVVDAIRIETDGVAAGMLNALRVLHNDFEGVTNAITINTAAPASAMPTGILVSSNRVETTTTFFNITGAAVTNQSSPPILKDNYLTTGSVTNYISNPNNQIIFSIESNYFGPGTRNYFGGNSSMQLITEGVGNNVVISDLSGNSNYAIGHLVLGSYHIWVEAATGKLRIKSSAPTSDSDGVVVGTQT